MACCESEGSDSLRESRCLDDFLEMEGVKRENVKDVFRDGLGVV